MSLILLNEVMKGQILSDPISNPLPDLVPISSNAQYLYLPAPLTWPLLPARASEQGNVIRCTKKIVIERTRDLNYLKFVAIDFSLKTISPSAGENSGDLA